MSPANQHANQLDITETPATLCLCVASNINLMPRLTGLCTEFLKRLGLGPCPHAALVVRELVSNAITHGNQNQLEKKVLLEIVHFGGRNFKIRVEDNGAGFNHHALNLTIPEDPRRLRQRGLVLVNAVSQAVEFNEAGNAVTAFLNV